MKLMIISADTEMVFQKESSASHHEKGLEETSSERNTFQCDKGYTQETLSQHYIKWTKCIINVVSIIPSKEHFPQISVQ